MVKSNLNFTLNFDSQKGQVKQYAYENNEYKLQNFDIKYYYELCSEKVVINSGEMPSLPLAYRLAKKCKKRKTLAKILAYISAIFIVGIIILPVFKLAGYALYLSAGGVFITLLASVVGLLNLKN